MVIENANAANRGAISQNVGAPVGVNPDIEDHIDDREESDHEEDLRVNTTHRTRQYTGDSDEEGGGCRAKSLGYTGSPGCYITNIGA